MKRKKIIVTRKKKVIGRMKEIPHWLSKRKEEIDNFALKSLLQEQKKVLRGEEVDEHLAKIRKQLGKVNSEKDIFMIHFEQFLDLLLIKHLGIRDESKLTEKEREILEKVAVNWFYKV